MRTFILQGNVNQHHICKSDVDQYIKLQMLTILPRKKVFKNIRNEYLTYYTVMNDLCVIYFDLCLIEYIFSTIRKIWVFCEPTFMQSGLFINKRDFLMIRTLKSMLMYTRRRIFLQKKKESLNISPQFSPLPHLR